MTAENDLNIILEFLSLHPRYIPGHNNTSLTEDKKSNLSQKFLNNVNRLNFPTKGTKASDSALAPVLKKMFETENIELSFEESENIRKTIKSAENFMGEMLELYIDSVASQYGWIRAAGSVVKSTDFIKKDESSGEITWKLLQIKNRDNTENSSSGAIRQGTQILKWSRLNSSNGDTYWDSIPIEECSEQFSENDYLNFVKNYVDSLD